MSYTVYVVFQAASLHTGPSNLIQNFGTCSEWTHSSDQHHLFFMAIFS